MDKKADFNEWYTEIVETAGLCDKRYPIKGMNIWTGYGWKAMRNIDNLFRQQFDDTGHDEVQFPLLIPETEFQKEADHIKGFGSQVYWVTHAGDNELDVRLLLRPTSETAMYPIFSLWVRSHADLPLKTYQIVNTFRYETKQTRAFMRVREIHFFEAHTCHDSYEDAEKQIQQDLDIMSWLGKKLCMPYILCKRPDWDKFAGAYYTIGIDSLMPTGRTLQMGSIHQYKDNFSIPYDIKYEDEKGQHKHVHQTTYGMSERILGALISIHGDDNGIIMPPEIAPIQIVIVPILAKNNKELVESAAETLKAELQDLGLRVHLDLRDLRPGNKYYDWELKGVPLRIELGGRDIENNILTVARRDTRERSTVPRDELDHIADLLLTVQDEMYDRAAAELKDNITFIDDFSQLTEAINHMLWCESEDCAHEIEDATGMAILGIPVDDPGKAGSCIICGKPTSTSIYASKTY